MIYFLGGMLLLGVFLAGARSFVQANPAQMAQQIRFFGGILLLALAGYFAVAGRIPLALPVAGIGLSLLGVFGWLAPAGGGRSRKSAGQRSRVRTALVEMVLDHDTGKMTGTVLEGTFQGQTLDSLTDTDLKKLWDEAAPDAQSRSLIEAYLDRRFASWREHFQADGADRHGSPASAGAMTNEEAYQILGLAAGAGDAEIRAAHRRLMKRLHPDHGGTSFLAAKLNEAKDTLLRRH